MRNRLIAVLAGTALASCQQQSAPEPPATKTAAETAAAPTAAHEPSAGNTEATARDDSAPAVAEADAKAAAPCAGDECPKPTSGYDWAAAHNIDDAKDCTEGDQDFKDGCVLYVQEKAVEEGEKKFESDDQ